MVINPVYEDALKSKMVTDPELGEISVYDLVMKRLEQMGTAEPAFEPFTGPLSDCAGNEILAEGQQATIPELFSLQWAAENVRAPLVGRAGVRRV